MLIQILIGAALMSFTIALETVAIGLAIMALERLGNRIRQTSHLVRVILLLNVVTLWMLLVLFLAVWIWAIALLFLGAFESLEPSLYFSAVSFTTLGFGDSTLPQEWRLLSGAIAANGLVLFSLSTAFLFKVLARLHVSSDDVDGQGANI